MHSHNARGVVGVVAPRLLNRSNYASRCFSTEGRLLNPNPRPTQYQTIIVNEAVNPPPGKPFSFTPILIGAGAFMVLFPCIQTTMELRKYYREVRIHARRSNTKVVASQVQRDLSYISALQNKDRGKREMLHILPAYFSLIFADFFTG
ncbi:hypothetical protein, conserved [Eimeria praecox]|uniref:Uncharacterized protein n=1 Tax=Eimeria praecox TaxID=51316 RepID=U6GYD3_9EIME|nr:hypothetical protein, conserved [Eimeria praecox]